MKAIFFRKHGDSSVLEYGDVQEPPLKSNAVLVRVKAVALNHLDIWVRIGWSGLKLPLPHAAATAIAVFWAKTTFARAIKFSASTPGVVTRNSWSCRGRTFCQNPPT